MINLNYGYFQPENPDSGDAWFPAMETNMTQLAAHNHDGVTSAPLATQQQSILSSNWISQGGGSYRQLLTVPTGLSYDTCHVWVKKSSGDYVYADVRRVSATTFYIYTTDNTLNLTVNYR